MTDPASQIAEAPEAIVVAIGDDPRPLLDKEWLITNRIGAYASSTVVGCNTRRYHGLLIAAAAAPVGRLLALATVMEELTVAGQTFELATNEFEDTFSPGGTAFLSEFRNDTAATFVYRADEATLTKEIMLAESANVVAVRYTLAGASGRLRLRPFVALRDYHHLRQADQPRQLTFEATDGGAMVQDLKWPDHTVYLSANGAEFESEGQWWHRFVYRADIARGQDGQEDLYCPGSFVTDLTPGGSCLLLASANTPSAVDFDATVAARSERLTELAESVGPGADQATGRLAAATNTFIATRTFRHEKPAATILAGYHWFADWGRDAFIALPGLLLTTGRFDLARQVFQTFASHIADGMVPNRFDDYSSAPHYNSIDASLWFIIAAERFLAATGDVAFWRNTLMPAADAILTAYHDGTRFDIRADGDGLLTGGSQETQLTWMDAKLGDEPITPRHGKPVEINALWHSAHRIMAERTAEFDSEMAAHYAHGADLIAPAFVRTFWNAEAGCLFDCVCDGRADATIRPNQIFAVSLPHSPLGPFQQRGVLRVVTRDLLTPMGLRTLTPRDERFRGRCGGSWESRDRAYHQGTVWAWLMGAFIEAYLKVEGAKPFAIEQARNWLSTFDEHLAEAGLGFISEIFDGEAPHAPRGCIAQAWSVAEVLRAKTLVEQYAREAKP